MTTTGFAERYLLDPGVNADPYPYLDALREHRPVYWSRIHRAWLVTGYEQVAECLGHPAVSADRVKPIMDNIPAGTTASDSLDEEARRAVGILSDWMVFNDPPQHRRLRAVFQDQFSARAINRGAEVTRRTAQALLARRAAPGTRGDAVADVARPLPSLAFTRWLGVPAKDGPSFWYWNARVGDLVLGASQTEREYRTSLRSLAKLYDFLADLVRARRAEPRDDLISAVLGSGAVGEAVSETEFVGMLTHLAFAGGETTGNLIANGLRAVLAHPRELAAVRDDPRLLSGLVEEALRFDGPSKMSVRVVAEDLELGGERLRTGDRVFLVTAAANRDPRRFEDAGRFDVRRGRTSHLGFGYGIHFCIGAPLARQVAGSALEVLVGRPGLSLAGGGHEWQLSLLNRSLKALPVNY